MPFFEIAKRIRDYKKRLASHTQKHLANQRYGRATNQRTLEAISNNKKWIEHWESILKQKEAQYKTANQELVLEES